jgi:hypothetical protein
MEAEEIVGHGDSPASGDLTISGNNTSIQMQLDLKTTYTIDRIAELCSALPLRQKNSKQDQTQFQKEST